MADELTEFEAKLLKWLIKSDFHIQPWSTKGAAKAFKVTEDPCSLDSNPRFHKRREPAVAQRTEF